MNIEFTQALKATDIALDGKRQFVLHQYIKNGEYEYLIVINSDLNGKKKTETKIGFTERGFKIFTEFLVGASFELEKVTFKHEN